VRITFIGHVCVDKNLIRGEIETFYGGGVIHGAVTAKRLGAEASVLTKCAEADREHFTSFRDAGVDATFLPSRSSTSIRNEYPTGNPDDRRSHIISRADPFSSADIASLEADVVHLVYDGRELYESPFTSFTVEGRTGRGDTCTAAFLVGMQRMGLREATALAAEVTSRKMQYRGAYRG